MKKEIKTITVNKKAFHNYSIEDEYVSAIQLLGCEIKSIRSGEVNISDTYCVFGGKNNHELFVKNMYIKPYENRDGFHFKLDPNRDRKLLLTKYELRKLEQKVKIKGYAIIPLRVAINENGYCKIIIGLCKGKKEYDKRQDIKERDIKRDMERDL